jgi:hypothetical protein
MPDFAGALGASKAATTLLVLFIPSKDRRNKVIDQRFWVEKALNVLGTLCGNLLFDEPVVIQCYTSEYLLEEKMQPLRDFLHRMGAEARQGAVGLVIDGDYLEIGFPLEESPMPRRPKGQRRR